MLAILLVLSGCGSSGVEQVADVDEVLVRTTAGTQGQNELAKVGVQLTGLLSCATEQVDDGVSVACTGTTVDGQAVQLSGTATSLPGGNAVQGDFVGAVAGKQVLSTECLGCP